MSKKYNIIYADPPWQFNSVKSGGSMKSGAAAHYSVMSPDQLKALDVPALCEKDCVLVMWYVSSQPQEALDLVKAWGFTLKNMNAFIWRKLSTNLIPHFGMGYWTRAGAECALIAVRGKPKAECRSIRQVRDEVVGAHSAKPAIFRDDIVKLCGDVPRLEMFARVSAPGWDVFGDEVESSVHIDGNEQADHIPAAGEMVEPEQAHKWPAEVLDIVESAIDTNPCEPTDEFYQELCIAANERLLWQWKKQGVIDYLVAQLQEAQNNKEKSCAA
ncbi:MT-A70 family methyltransferase [Arsukibacterium sp.]|uniref:MT-A70 family methyltransferase n=1 Tax=Arsukibacterium sp. TaxID=1977258 RepID=UPI00299E5ACF|nr:MT-A70 family methyltransferase [Arsukibacterium sp.]MDX1538858.1 MT-A70 family methyltransferase [Arsukibacterium sp.]